MDGLSFITAAAPVRSDPARADIACFMGFAARRTVPGMDETRRLEGVLATLGWTGPALPVGARLLPTEVTTGDGGGSFAAWLRRAGWHPWRDDEKPIRPPVRDGELLRETLGAWHSPALASWWVESGYLEPASGLPAVDFLELRDVPVPVDTWEIFDALFAWDLRPVTAAGDPGRTMLGAAVRSFFAQGGRKCHVVRLGDAWTAEDGGALHGLARDAYLPALPPISPVSRSTWRGVGHLLALTDVSFLCLPDLPELFTDPLAGAPIPPPAPGPESFVECSPWDEPAAPLDLRGVSAPRCDEAGFRQWALLAARVGEFLARLAREVQFIAALPLSVEDPGDADGSRRARAAGAAQWEAAGGFRTAFVQLAYPWLRTPGANALPGGVEAPDGALAGVLANSALTRGSWRSALWQPLRNLAGVVPVLDRATLARDLSPAGPRRAPLTVRDRLTLVGPAPGGFRLLSDVTTSPDESYRPACVNRLVSALVRAARVAGESAAFRNNGPALWAILRETMTDLLAGLWAEGALDGDTASAAFDVRCDRSVMTQSDLDAGRLVCLVTFTAAAPIVHVTVVLAMDEGGQISLASREAPARTQAA